MRKETQKVVQGVVFGCVVGIPSALLVVKELGLSALWAVLLGIVFMASAAIMYDPKDAWKITKGAWNETCMWRPDAAWWRVLRVQLQGAAALALSFSVVWIVIMSILGGLGFPMPTIMGLEGNSPFILLFALWIFLLAFLISTAVSEYPSRTTIKEAEKEKDRLYMEVKGIYKWLILLPIWIFLYPLFWIIVRMPNWWYYSGKPFICKVFTRLATAGRKVTFWCTGIGFATGVSYGLVADIGYIAPTLIGTITGVAVAILSVEIIPIRILKLQVK